MPVKEPIGDADRDRLGFVGDTDKGGSIDTGDMLAFGYVDSGG